MKQLIDVLDGDEIKARKIISIADDITRYSLHLDAIALGVAFAQSDILFSDLILFRWIKDGLSGRKN